MSRLMFIGLAKIVGQRARVAGDVISAYTNSVDLETYAIPLIL